jgi:hypothetical protein
MWRLIKKFDFSFLHPQIWFTLMDETNLNFSLGKIPIRYYEIKNEDLKKAFAMLKFCSNEKVIDYIKRTEPRFTNVKEYEEEFEFLPQYFKKEINQFR